jgi:hypothetical protein
MNALQMTGVLLKVINTMDDIVYSDISSSEQTGQNSDWPKYHLMSAHDNQISWLWQLIEP